MSYLLLVGEGVSETGTDFREGFFSCLLSQLAAGDDHALPELLGVRPWDAAHLPTCHYRSGLELARTVQLDSPQPHGMERAAARALRAAQILQCDAVVLLVDNDHQRERRAELDRGFADCPLPHAHSVAKEMLESWLLADPEALSPVVVTLSKPPENIWGAKRDPQSEYPKNVLRRALTEAGIGFAEVLGNWAVSRAAPRAPLLCAFCRMIVVELLSNHTLCRPLHWD